MTIRLTVLILSFLSLAACGESSTTPSAVTNVATLPADQVIYGLHHVITKDGIRSSVLDGDSAYRRDEGASLEVFNVHLAFFGENGSETGRLTSAKGSYRIDTGDFVARDHVVLVTEGTDGERTIETDELNYQRYSDQLWSDKPFVLRQGGRVTRGTSFHTDGKFQSWTANDIATEGGLPEAQGQAGGISF